MVSCMIVQVLSYCVANGESGKPGAGYSFKTFSKVAFVCMHLGLGILVCCVATHHMSVPLDDRSNHICITI